ncbi:hypothetical protein [Streptomyces sp. NPDC002588]|uniref:hypothetical protein n=1 Tax=Streptomyces sp. NPDC002588 TaxID=3154419 RepID=UPI003323A216
MTWRDQDAGDVAGDEVVQVGGDHQALLAAGLAARLPRPRSVKPASAAGACGLCGDGYNVGDLIGRTPSPEELPYIPMGWLCRHCLVQRRQQPRRRDVLLRCAARTVVARTVVGRTDPPGRRAARWAADRPKWPPAPRPPTPPRGTPR